MPMAPAMARPIPTPRRACPDSASLRFFLNSLLDEYSFWYASFAWLFPAIASTTPVTVVAALIPRITHLAVLLLPFSTFAGMLSPTLDAGVPSSSA